MKLMEVTVFRNIIAGAVGLVFLTISAAAHAAIVLDFEGLQDLEYIESFYDGGAGSMGSTSGVDYNIVFSSDAQAVIDKDAGGSGDIGGEPSGDTAMFFLKNTAVLNVSDGFTLGFSFYYSAVNVASSIDVWSGLDKSGTKLASLTLPMTISDDGDPNGKFSPFYALGVSFAGTAMSIDFGGTANQVAFDDITIGSSTPGKIPEPASLLLFGSGLLGLGWLRRRRRTA
jgi:hypothetical protein